MHNKNRLAPIVLFVYNRPKHTRLTLEALLKNPEAKKSHLYVFSDAAKCENDIELVNEVRNLVKKVVGFNELKIIEREKNYGLAGSVIEGVTRIINFHGKLIVLEDDLEVSPFFLKFMNDALFQYENVEEVGSISGYMYPVDVNPIPFFRQTPQSWGWATWLRAWNYFQADGSALIKKLEFERKALEFNRAGHLPLLKMLKDQVAGKNNSWYVRWSASLYLKEMLTLMPHRSLVRNLGIDGTGTHCAYWYFNPYDCQISSEKIDISDVGKPTVNIKTERQLHGYFLKVRFLRYVNFFYRIIYLGKHKLKMNR